jgi:hypothetical protein
MLVLSYGFGSLENRRLDVGVTDGLSRVAVSNGRTFGELGNIDLRVLYILLQRLLGNVLRTYETPIKDRLYPLAKADP